MCACVPSGPAQDTLRPFIIACESKTPKLVVTALGAIQKLLANDAIAPQRVESVLSALQQVQRRSCLRSACM